MYTNGLEGKTVLNTWISDSCIEIEFTDGTKFEILLRCNGEGHLSSDITE